MTKEFLCELTHDNHLFEQSWPEIFDQIREIDVSLNDLVEYFLTEPIDQTPVDVKFIFIEKILRQLNENEQTIDIQQLIHAFIRILNSSRNDLWQLHFLETLWKIFQLENRLTQQPMETDLIEEISRNLQMKSLNFRTQEENEKWTTFLTESVFSIVPNMLPQTASAPTDDLEKVVRLNISLCSFNQNPELFCSEVYKNLILKLDNLSIDKNLSSLFFELAVAILKLHTINAPNACYRLIRREHFYSWKDLNDQIIDLIRTCISYDNRIDNDFFSELTRLTDIIDYLQGRIVITDEIQSIVVETIFRWTQNDFPGSSFLYRMGVSLLVLIDSKDINEEICLKFIEILQNRTDLNQAKPLFTEIARYLGIQIERLKTLSSNIHSKLANLFLSLIDRPLIDESQNMTCEHIILINCLYRSAATISHDDHARFYEPLLDRMYLLGQMKEKQIDFFDFWAIFWSMIAFKIPNISKNHIKQFFEYTFQTKDTKLIGSLTFLSTQYIELFTSYLDPIIDIVFLNNGQYLYSFVQILTSIIRYRPVQVTSKQITKIFSSIETISFNPFVALLIQSLGSVACCQPNLFEKYLKTLLDLSLVHSNLLIFECYEKALIASLILHDNSEQINETLTFLIDLLANQNHSDELQKQIVYICLLIAVKYKSFVVQRRDDFVRLNLNLIVHFIDGNTTSKIDQSIIEKAEIDIETIERQIVIPNIDKQRPKSASQIYPITNQRTQRTSSLSYTPQSRACILM